MNSKPVKQYAEVVNGVIHITLPEDFNAKRVELTIVPLDDDTSTLSDSQTLRLSDFQTFRLSKIFNTDLTKRNQS